MGIVLCGVGIGVGVGVGVGSGNGVGVWPLSCSHSFGAGEPEVVTPGVVVAFAGGSVVSSPGLIVGASCDVATVVPSGAAAVVVAA